VSFHLGQTVELSFTTDPAEAGTVVVTRPDGTLATPVLAGVPGAQTALVEVDQLGAWSYAWESPNAGQRADTFVVATDSGVTLDHVKAALNKTDSADDDELQRLLDAALTEYEQYVGPLPGPAVQGAQSGSTVILPARVTSVQAATSTTGEALTFLLAAGGVLTTSSWGPVVVSYTVGPLPANHVETIIADVAGLFAATQRGGGATAPRFPGDGYAAALETPPGRPVVLFPRIRALAPMGVA
jgi:hypothetical protein